MAVRPTAGVLLATLAAFALSGCAETGGFPFGTARTGATTSETTRLVERDVEAPEVYQASAQGLWDGRPSLGGVWVAKSDVTDPERVIIRNEANGRFVIGALFRREQANPGPPFQVSSDAAEALGMLAGQPAALNVTALRREEVSETPDPAPAGALPPAGEVSETSLEDTAAAAIAAAEASPAAAPAAAPTSGLDRPYVQIGIFSIEANATATADRLRRAGLLPTVLDQTSRGSRFWRVVVGPVPTAAERAQILQTVKGLGFTDAYAVRR